MSAAPSVSPGWVSSVHESAHCVVAVLSGARVATATVRLDHSGTTEALSSPWRGCMTAVAGHEGEKLLLPPEVVEPWRSEPDMRHARACALALVASGECRRAARYLSRPGPAPAKVHPAPALQPDPEVLAFVAAFEKARLERREERARRLVAFAKVRARRLLSANVLVVRTIAVRLSQVGVLGGDEVLALYHEGRARQLQDDRRMGGRRA